MTDEDIFNRYTGDGGLHGLRRSDYENYNAFSAAKKELENGQFFTPPPLCEMIVSALRLTDTDLVADLTCGMGNFFNFLPNENTAYGCEVDPNACAVARKLYPQAHIVQGDIRDYEPQTHFDFVLGNPPFHLRWIMPDATVMTSHQYYCLKAAKLLKPLGILAVIVPASFLADSFSDKGAIRMMESRFSFLGQVMLPEHAFSDSGVDGFPTKLQFWQKKSTAADWTPKRYSTDCSDIYIPSGHPVMAATALYEKFVMVAKADLAGNRNKVFLELAQLKTTKSTFLYQVKKYLYQIRSHPVTREKYDACFAYVHRFYTQRQPADMPYEEWQRVQLTEAKVLAYLKQALCRQNAKPERDEIRLVKQKYSFVYKAYSRKMAKLLTDEMRAPLPIYQAVLNDEPERFPGYERLLRRKRREYDNQEQPFSEMAENAQLADWIGRFQYLSVAIVDVSAGQDLCLVIKICQNNTLSIFNGKERIVFAVDKTNHTIIPVRIRKSKNAHDIYRLVVGHRASPLSFFGVVRFFSYSASFAFAHSGSLFVSATPRTSVMSHRHRSPEYNSSK